MKPAMWMAGGSIAAWGAASLTAPMNPEAFFGMLGPRLCSSSQPSTAPSVFAVHTTGRLFTTLMCAAFGL